jgi:exopolyphosphatase/guanosine-5'-triphosphate,3'-diphosphate pyrophosphatase
VIDEERFCTRLARSLGSTGELDASAMDQTVQALRHFRQMTEGLQVQRLETIATCAVREASNAGQFLRRIEKEVGLKVRVISATKEGLLAFRSVQAAFDLADQNVAVVDIGGGSTEIIMASRGHVEKTYSTTLGAVRMTELFGGSRELFDSEHERLLDSIDREVKHQIRKQPFVPQIVYGTGGTFTTIASILLAKGKEDLSSIWGYRLNSAEVRHLLERIRRMSPKERRNVTGLGADRADIIVAGLAIVDRVMARLKANNLRVHTGGVRDGLLLSMLDDMDCHPNQKRHEQSAVEHFAVSCGADLTHSRHIALLATQIFDGLAETFPFDPADRRLVEVAAILQDVGYLINYRAHHKHSYQLILNSRLPGFRKQDLSLIASIARYHRGARPKKKHPNFRHLPPCDQKRVLRLSAILRLAGGLDRGYSQKIKKVRVEQRHGQIHLICESSADAELELWAARERANLFERAFQSKLVVAHHDSTTANVEPLPVRV